MSDLLRPGQTVDTQTGGQCRVDKFLGSGGQGEVFRATWSGGEYALKWYYPHTGTAEQRKALEDLIETGPPSDRFLWPLALAQSKGMAAYGYLMPLREPHFKSLNDLMLGTIDPTYRALVTAALQLVDCFFTLHAKGLCYRDISFGNAFFDPTTGDVLVCDNDNVAANRTPITGVLGTPDFMAPEIVRGDTVPSRQTDMYSLAVLLFYMFCTNHPLLGKKILKIRSFDLPRNKLYGAEPTFIFDPSDRSNEAVMDPLNEAGTNALKTWPILPQYLRNAFLRSFTAGLKDPDHGRVTEGEWRSVLSRCRDSIFRCACNAENFYDTDAVQESRDNTLLCWSCHKMPTLPFRIRIGKSTVMLNADSHLYAHHLDDQQGFDFSRTVADVVRHPTNPSVWGLKNCTTSKWVATMPDGATKDVEPAKSVPLAAKTKISFGKLLGEILY